MATIVTVHGTFAHVSSDAAVATERQWWQGASEFEKEALDALSGSEGVGKQVEIAPFTWSGENSELARRAAGKQLFQHLKSLEAKGESYCVVGHSHGGSVINWALLEAAARKQSLPGLKRWITVGTPFVSHKKEPLLFQRLDLMKKVVFVASFMLVLMFAVYMLAEAISGKRMLFGATFPMVLLVTGAMMSLPILFFYATLKYWDNLSLGHYRRSVKERAEKTFAQRWLSLTHTDDEAVQGLAFLPGARLQFFEKSFAVPAITMLSILAVPLIYAVLLFSPSAMLGIGDWLKTHVYDNPANAAAEQELRSQRQALQVRLRASRTAGSSEVERRELWQQYRNLRRNLEGRYPNLHDAERSLRFKQRFFEEGGKPCPGGRLCGEGHDIRINSGLLLHTVTDELSSAIGGEGVDERANWWLRLAIPAVLVPIAFGLLSLLMMLVVRTLANVVSHVLSLFLNDITNAEVKRAAFGNDTENEIALGAVDRPHWIGASPPRLPGTLADLVTAYSNGIATQSLAKFRRAIGQLASAEPKHTADSAITTYFTWKELVHSSYFDVPEFRRLVLHAIGNCEGFVPKTHFLTHPISRPVAQWLAEIEGTASQPVVPAAKQQTPEDKAAVAAAVASTVTRET